MAKKSEYKFLKKDRTERIVNCGDCGGDPPVSTFNLQGMVGTHCTRCMEVITWKNENTSPVMITKIESDNTYDKLAASDIKVTQVPHETVDKIKFTDLL